MFIKFKILSANYKYKHEKKLLCGIVFQDMEIKGEAGWHKGMGSQKDNGIAVLTYITISVPVNGFCTVSLQEFLHFQQTIA
jgi:hypothetical protein